ncbi:LOW QUALITY PROTEIN: cytochrome P450 family protein [Cinnamomum micranthum f. kanehirae]|uniref:Cytochrome P450 family protein n=1 Tax=Cinnamomum micranthum f. kanehirae TaxID=337451 RepID=A0A3S3N753_9MAGN|nr:LOW QUALITY PROTEIN: cytochrome P450 family protein [Cinnamomum micranthum f. kanehirae]
MFANQDLFVAGSNTNSSPIEWAMAKLLHNPDTMSMARSGNHPQRETSGRIRYCSTPITYKQKPCVYTHQLPSSSHTELSLLWRFVGLSFPSTLKLLRMHKPLGGTQMLGQTNPASFLPERFLHSKLDFKLTIY